MAIRALRLLPLLLGLGVVAWLVLRRDPVALMSVLPRIGWGFVAIVAVRGLTILVDAGAWASLLQRPRRPSVWRIWGLRWIGEAVNSTLPVAQIGGDVVRARLLQRRLRGPARGAGSVIVDICLNLFAQILFTLLGLVLLLRADAALGWWPLAAAATLMPVFAIASWELLVRRRLLRAAERLMARLRQRRLAALLRALGLALALIARSRAALAVALGLHLCSWFSHAAETWLTLRLIGTPAGFAAALLVESLSLAARSAAFLIPAGWGAQEAALVGLAAAAGLGADTGLALALVKRARELAVGLPGLVAWGIAERRR